VAVKIYVAGCVLQHYAVVIADVSKELIPSICREWDGGVLFFRKILGNCTVAAPDDQNVTARISVCSRAHINLSCSVVFYNVITPRFFSYPVISAYGIIKPCCWFVLL
jgi:hypothetical protein